MPRSALTTFATRHQTHLERLKAGLSRDFVGRLRKIDAAVLRTLAKLGVEELSQATRGELERTLKELDSAQGDVFDAALDTLLPKLAEVAAYESAFEISSFGKLVSHKFKHPPAAVLWKEVQFRPIQATGEKLDDFTKHWKARQISRVNKAVRNGYEQGKTVAQIAREVRGTRARNFKDGIVSATSREAQAVVHTAVQHTSSTARFVTWEENADVVQGYEFLATLDASTTTQCRSLDGQKFLLGKGPRPPLHVRCRSTTVAVLSSALDFLDSGATRSAQFGPVAADLKYYDWLKQQPEAYQKTVLGPTRLKLFRSGGLTSQKFAELQLDRKFEPLTLAEMRLLEPAAFAKAGL